MPLGYDRNGGEAPRERGFFLFLRIGSVLLSAKSRTESVFQIACAMLDLADGEPAKIAALSAFGGGTMDEIDKAKLQQFFPNTYLGDVSDCRCGWTGIMGLMIVVYANGGEQPNHLHCPCCSADHDIDESSTHY